MKSYNLEASASWKVDEFVATNGVIGEWSPASDPFNG